MPSTDAIPGGNGAVPAREIELKLAIERDTLIRLQRSGAFARLPGIRAAGRSHRENLVAIYWDTPDRDLAKNGVALRIRREGARTVQTVKAEDRNAGLAADRRESNVTLPGSSADVCPDPALIEEADLRKHVTGLIGKNRLEPVFETDVARVSRTYIDNRSGKFEAALDMGQIRANGNEVAISEIELEWKAGSPASLLEAARALAGRYPLRVGSHSKAARGYALAGGDAAPGPAKAEKEVLTGAETVPQAFSAILSECVNQFASNQAAILEARDPAGIHQMRVAIRRYRAAYSAFKKAVPLGGADEVISSLKSLFRLLGDTRDLDVFCTETLPAVGGSDPGRLSALAAAAEEARREAWEMVITELESPGFTCLLLDAGLLAARAEQAECIAEENTLAEFAAARLSKRLKQVRKRAKKLEALDDEGRHDLRKRLKKLRYEAEFFAPLWKKGDTRDFLKPLKKLQDAFGAVNDAATARKVARTAAARIGGPDAAGAAGYVAGWYAAEAEHAFAGARTLWDKVSAVTPFWTGDA